MNRGVKRFFTAYYPEIFVFLVFFAALFFRFYTNTYHLLMVPDYDGYQYVKIAKNMTKGVFVTEMINWTPLLPAIIAIFSFLPLPLDEIGSVINIVFGAATVFPIYLLVKNILNKEAAFFSILLYAFHPQIAFVNVQVMSETTYIFVFFLYAYLISEILKGKYTLNLALISGVCGGLIYLGRPEGILIYLALTFFCFIIAGVEIIRKLKWLVVNLIFFALTISPYLIFLKKMRGQFVFSGKSSEILWHIKNMMGIPDVGQGFFATFTYDLSKTYSFLNKNLSNAVWIFSDYNYFFGILLLLSTIFFVYTLNSSKLGWKSLIFFISMILPFAAPLIFKVDERYLSPTTSVISVCFGIGLFGVYKMFKLDTKAIIAKFFIYLVAFLLFTFWGYYKIYARFEKYGELNEIFAQERLYKKTGEWLKAHIPEDATLISTSTNYLIAYYAGDMKFENASRNLSEEELVELVCKSPHRYLIVNEFSITKYHKDLRFLINPYSQGFKNSKLSYKIYPIYYDEIALVAVYACKSGENEKDK